jgi:hypothetical protein
MYMDLNKRVYNHVPGECNTIASMENGAVDIILVSAVSRLAKYSIAYFMDNYLGFATVQHIVQQQDRGALCVQHNVENFVGSIN